MWKAPKPARSAIRLSPPGRLPSGHRITVWPPRDTIREATHDVDGNQEAQIPRWRRKILPGPAASKIEGPSGMSASLWPLTWYLRPFSTEVTRVFTCSSSEVIASFIALNGSSGSGDITSSMWS